MSTKTTFKRIALVAVAALGFGVLSVVPSQAAAGPITLTVEKNGTARLDSALGAGETSTGIIFTASSLLTAGIADSITVQFIATGNQPVGAVGVRAVMTFLESTTASSGTITSQTSTAGALIEQYSSATGDSVTSGALIIKKKENNEDPQIVGARFAISLDSNTAATRKAGTYNFLIIAEGYSNGVKNDALRQTAAATITIEAAALPAAATAGAATAYIQAGATVGSWTGVVADSATSGSLLAGTPIGVIRVVNQSVAGTSAVDTITVAMTGVGYLKTGTEGPGTAVIGRSFVVPNEDILDMQVIADGSSGTGTITITTGVGASFVKTVTFFDTKPATVAATVSKAFIKAGTANVVEVFAVSVKDVLGNDVTNATITAAPTDTATTVGGKATCLPYDTTDKAYWCGVAGLSSTKFGPVAYTITATGDDTAKTALKTSATVTFADTVATKAVLAGPATGTPGATVEYTLTLTEKNGYPVADQVYGLAAEGGVLFAKSVPSGFDSTMLPFAVGETFTSVSGVITSEGKLPFAGTGTLTLTLVGDGLQTLATSAIDKTIGKTDLTVSTEVANPGVDAATDAANEATDAANAATDAALAAAEAADAATTAAQEASDAVAALSESVTKLIAGLQAQIKSLAAVVAKIAKKVKA